MYLHCILTLVFYCYHQPQPLTSLSYPFVSHHNSLLFMCNNTDRHSSICLSLPPSLFLFLPPSLFLALSLRLYFSLSLHLSFSLSPSVSISLSSSVSLSLSSSVSLSLFLSSPPPF